MKSEQGSRSFLPIIVLLSAAVLINYVDRGNLALAAPLLKTEWHISASKLGILLSAFFWSYMLLQFVVGSVIDRFNVCTVMTIGFVVWSLSTAATGFVTGFATLLTMRLILGAGESVMFPACSKIFATQLPERSRGLANAIIIASIRWGSAIGTFGGGLLMAKYGWRSTFIAVGLAGLLWLPAWQRWKPDSSAAPSKARRAEPHVAAIVRQRSFWGASTGHFCGNYLLYFLISWLPYYLVHERHLSMGNMAGIAGVLYSVDSMAAIATGWIADRFIARGHESVTVRKSSMAVGFSIATLGLMACAFAGPHTYFWCLLVTGIGVGSGSSGAFAVGQTLAGPRMAGRWIGLQNGVANLSGVTGPALTGFLIDRTGNFDAALGTAASIALCGALAWVFVVRKPAAEAWLVIQDASA